MAKPAPSRHCGNHGSRKTQGNHGQAGGSDTALPQWQRRAAPGQEGIPFLSTVQAVGSLVGAPGWKPSDVVGRADSLPAHPSPGRWDESGREVAGVTVPVLSRSTDLGSTAAVDQGPSTTQPGEFPGRRADGPQAGRGAPPYFFQDRSEKAETDVNESSVDNGQMDEIDHSSYRDLMASTPGVGAQTPACGCA